MNEPISIMQQSQAFIDYNLKLDNAYSHKKIYSISNDDENRYD